MIRTPRTLFVCSLLAVSAMGCSERPASTELAADAVHAAHAALTASTPATRSAGHPWLADAPLRAGMARVRKATDALAHLERGHPDPTQVTAAADDIHAAVNTMFADCRLAPQPDAALHPLLARLLAASRALREAPTQPAPLAELRDVLLQYGKLFDERGGSVATN